ncbi:hypothetical protein KSP39_PZI011001 [Platanthera zijinensis]|uniref:Uncharacterized protein n=1 Tax=Platanthera zijinensis TaxID=2320716 RepID=A0AAP0BH49_9ASPA
MHSGSGLGHRGNGSCGLQLPLSTRKAMATLDGGRNGIDEGLRRRLNHWNGRVDKNGADWGFSSVLADVIESIAGAIYEDSGRNKGIVWASIRPLLEPLVNPRTMEIHPVRELEELCSQNSYKKSFSAAFTGGLVSVTVEVEADPCVHRATATGLNKKVAKKLAAKEVLKIDRKIGFSRNRGKIVCKLQGLVEWGGRNRKQVPKPAQSLHEDSQNPALMAFEKEG